MQRRALLIAAVVAISISCAAAQGGLASLAMMQLTLTCNHAASRV
jgi:hypothetical protein